MTSSGEEVLKPKVRRPGPRSLAAVGVVLCLIVGGIIVSVFRGNGPKETAAISRENPERPNAPRFLERKPGAMRNASLRKSKPGSGIRRRAGSSCAICSRRERRRHRRPRRRSSRAEPQGGPLRPQGLRRHERRVGRSADGGGDGAPPPGVYRPYPVRTNRPNLCGGPAVGNPEPVCAFEGSRGADPLRRR